MVENHWTQASPIVYLLGCNQKEIPWQPHVGFAWSTSQKKIIDPIMAQQTYLKFSSCLSGQNGLEVWPCALEK